MNKFVQTANYETVSDHDLRVFTVKIKGNVVNKEVSIGGSFKDFNIDYFKLDLLVQQWTRIYEFKDPSVIAGMINEFFTEVLDMHAPSTLTIKQEGMHELKLLRECLNFMKDGDKLNK